jgi:hypothetical protein
MDVSQEDWGKRIDVLKAGSPPAQPFSNPALTQLSSFSQLSPNYAQLSPRPTQPLPNSALFFLNSTLFSLSAALAKLGSFPTQPSFSSTQPSSSSFMVRLIVSRNKV